MPFDRRTLLQQALLFTGATVAAAALPVSAAMMPLLKETDPEAAAISYFSNARKVDTQKYPTYAAGQTCANCALAGFSSAMRKPCKLVPGKLVEGNGWCLKWAGKA
jgi:hypothetical protein